VSRTALTINQHLRISKRFYGTLSKPLIPLGESVMRLRGTIYKLNIPLNSKDINSVNIARMKLCDEIDLFKYASAIYNKDSLISRQLILIGRENIKFVQESLDIASQYLRPTLKSVEGGRNLNPNSRLMFFKNINHFF